ncbi:inverse autotransporter beta domain-containing protein [Candidatus Pelagibacter sp.]|nr:inverse autotransporter beta domain-containing protein [Candidatus Pelagibacter sp.]
MKFLRYLLPATLSLLIATNVSSQDFNLDLKGKAKGKISSFKDAKINAYTQQFTDSINSFIKNNFESNKYLDFSVNTQEYLKPTFNIMSVNEIMKINNGTIFNQTSINTHDGDETINIGFGTRKLLNDNTIIFGANAFYDHQLTESHERVGLGVEAITSDFDLRYNHYSAMSGRRTNAEGTIERALDGWDLRADYHLPIDHDVNVFVSAFEFENTESVSSYKETGNKFGVDAKVGNFAIEVGYMDDNQENDAYFGNVKYVVNFGSDNQDHSSSNSKSLTDVSDRLYEPVKRENKIRVVKIDASGVVVGGF